MTTTELNKQLGTETVTWKLEDLYTSPESDDINNDIAWCKGEAAMLQQNYKGTIDTLGDTQLTELVERIEILHTRLGKLATYGFLNFITQVNDAQAGAFYQQIRELSSDIEGDLVFFELEWNNLDDEQVRELLSHKSIAHYSHYLNTLRRYRPHQLSEIEEKLLIGRKTVGRSSWTTLFEKVISHIRFGTDKRTEEEVLTDLYNADRRVRAQAAEDLTEGLQSQNHILTHIFNTLAAEKMITDKQRNHASWVGSMNLDNQVESATVDALIDSVTSRYDIVHRYYTVKKKLLGLDELVDYDRYAPLPSLPTKNFSWGECKAIVLTAFHDFSPELGDIAARFFDNSYIHAPVMEGKRGGAFAHPCVPEVHPYVLVNYTGSMRDISTVAHELGHGIHQVLASEKGYFYSDTPLVLAETASVFAELVVFKAQLELLSSEDEKKGFICQKLESIFATVFRQTAMNRFEDAMHNGRRKYGELSSETLSEYWIQTQSAMFGDSISLSNNYSSWWSYIPHFLATPGYVYSYAFGELLVLALYGTYEKEGNDFIEKYINLLKAGGSESPYDLLKPFDISLNDPQFWHQGLTIIEELLQQVEQ